jgi:hypothetical protein
MKKSRTGRVTKLYAHERYETAARIAGGHTTLINHARRAWVWLAPQSGADWVVEAPLGPGFVMQTELEQTPPQSSSLRHVAARRDRRPRHVARSHARSIARADGGTPERLSPQGRTAVGRGFNSY